MAKFEKRKWQGTHYKVRPLGWRKYFQLGKFVFPYFAPDKIKFSIEITKIEDIANPGHKKLSGMDIYEIIPDKETRQIFSHRNLPSSEKRFEFDDEGYTEGGVVKYLHGEPGADDTHPLIIARVYYNDDVWLKIIFPVIMGVFGIVLGWLLNKAL